MASVSTDKGGDRLNTELNLVPFIDLLSSLVLFLLITAVWLQVSAIPASVDSKGKKAISPSPVNRLVVRVTAGGLELTWPDAKAANGLPNVLPRTPAGYALDRLGELLAPVAKAGRVTTVAVTGDDGVDYGVVVQAIDVAKQSGFASIAVATN